MVVVVVVVVVVVALVFCTQCLHPCNLKLLGDDCLEELIEGFCFNFLIAGLASVLEICSVLCSV